MHIQDGVADMDGIALAQDLGTGHPPPVDRPQRGHDAGAGVPLVGHAEVGDVVGGQGAELLEGDVLLDRVVLASEHLADDPGIAVGAHPQVRGGDAVRVRAAVLQEHAPAGDVDAVVAGAVDPAGAGPASVGSVRAGSGSGEGTGPAGASLMTATVGGRGRGGSRRRVGDNGFNRGHGTGLRTGPYPRPRAP